MSLRISGMGWVTPHGSDVSNVWERLRNGESANAEMIANPLDTKTYPVFRVPASATATAPAHPRLRRSSAISHFAVVAGLSALADAKVEMKPEVAERTALIFAISNGGVVYTKRFYHEIVESGSQAASPLLFPETVFNAPASHLAAILGITGASYTLVGDGAVGMLALKMAEDLLASESLDHCLVVGAEEADWLLCDAYRKWRLTRKAPPIEPFQDPASGTILSEGAGAILLGRTGAVQIEQIAAGTNFRKQRDAGRCVDHIFSELSASSADLVIASANGTFIDRAEEAAIGRHCPNAGVYTVKPALGEPVGASALWQTICGVQSLITQTVPPTLHLPGGKFSKAIPPSRAWENVLVSSVGLNQQVAGLFLARG